VGPALSESSGGRKGAGGLSEETRTRYPRPVSFISLARFCGDSTAFGEKTREEVSSLYSCRKRGPATLRDRGKLAPSGEEAMEYVVGVRSQAPAREKDP